MSDPTDTPAPGAAPAPVALAGDESARHVALLSNAAGTGAPVPTVAGVYPPDVTVAAFHWLDHRDGGAPELWRWEPSSDAIEPAGWYPAGEGAAGWHSVAVMLRSYAYREPARPSEAGAFPLRAMLVSVVQQSDPRGLLALTHPGVMSEAELAKVREATMAILAEAGQPRRPVLFLERGATVTGLAGDGPVVVHFRFALSEAQRAAIAQQMAAAFHASGQKGRRLIVLDGGTMLAELDDDALALHGLQRIPAAGRA